MNGLSIIKKTIGIMAFSLMTFSISSSADSNPAVWNTPPSVDTLTLKENTPIEIIAENLNFELAYEPIAENQLPLYTRVTYQMHNTSVDPERVTLAFPFVARMTEMAYKDIHISVDGVDLPYEIYTGERVHDSNSGYDVGDYYQFDFEDHLATIKKWQEPSEILNETSQGYHYNLKTTSDSSTMYMKVTLPVLDEATRAVAIGPWRGWSDAENLYFEGVCTEETPFEIFVFCGTTEPIIQVYETSEQDKPLDDTHYTFQGGRLDYHTVYDVFIDPVAAKQFDYFEESTGKSSIFGRDERFKFLTGLFVEATSNPLTRAISATEANEFINAFSPNRYMTLVYETSFKPGETKEVIVEYETMASYDTTEDERVLYGFDYLFSPATRWQSFKDLTIDIQLDDKMGPLRYTSLALEKVEDGHYQGQYITIPDFDLEAVFYGPDEAIVAQVADQMKKAQMLEQGLELPVEEEKSLLDELLQRLDGITVSKGDIVGIVIGGVILGIAVFLIWH